MTPAELDRIIAGLSEAQKDACRGRIVHIAKRDSLVAIGILTNDGGRNWTEKGRAVRNRIMETGK